MSEISETEIKSMTKEQNYMRGYGDGKSDVLDKIRAEIDAHREKLKIMADDDWYAGKIRGYDCAIEIIDRYKKP